MRLLRPAVIGSAVALVVAGCGSDSPSAQDYLGELEALTTTHAKSLDELTGEFDNRLLGIDFQAVGAEEELVVLFQETINGSLTAFTALASGLVGLEPPSEFEASHTGAIASADRVISVFHERRQQLDSITDLAEVDEFATDDAITQARNRYLESCLELQTLAGQEGIVVDLNC